MKYKLAKELIEKIKTFNEIDGDLIIFKKPYNKKFHFKFKDGTEKVLTMNDYSYISLSNHGFLFIQNNPYKTIPIHLNHVEDIIVK